MPYSSLNIYVYKPINGYRDAVAVTRGSLASLTIIPSFLKLMRGQNNVNLQNSRVSIKMLFY